MKILIVDDDNMIRSVVKVALQKVNSWEVVEAASGSDSRGSARLEQPDSILLDYQVPVMGGSEVIASLRSNTITMGIPVIMLTAKRRKRARSAYEQMGTIGTIENPFDPLTQGKEITALLDRAP